jgi:hypothetical protein
MTEVIDYSKHFHGKNFITPHIIQRGVVRGTVYELSRGKGIFSDELFGVTISAQANPRHKSSQAFTTRKEAENFIKSL